MTGNMMMWELIPGVVVAVPLPQRWVFAVSCVMASQCVSRVVGYCIQIVHNTLCGQRQHSQYSSNSAGLERRMILLPSPADTHRCFLMQTPAGPVLWEGSLHMLWVCWIGSLSRRNVSGLRETLSQETTQVFSHGCLQLRVKSWWANIDLRREKDTKYKDLRKLLDAESFGAFPPGFAFVARLRESRREAVRYCCSKIQMWNGLLFIGGFLPVSHLHPTHLLL